MKRIIVFFLSALFFFSLCLKPHATIYRPNDCETLEEYNKFVAENTFPPEFVQYKDLSYIGDFLAFNGEPTRHYYTYDFILPCGAFLEIEFDNEPLSGLTPATPILEPSENSPSGSYVNINEYAEKFLREQPGNKRKSCLYKIGSLYYRYFIDPLYKDGEFDIDAIFWENEEKTRGLRIRAGVCSSADPHEGCFLQELLNYSTVEEAQERFLESIGRKIEKPLVTDDVYNLTDTNTLPSDDSAPFPWVWVAVPAAAVLVCGGLVAAVVLIRRKKKSKS